MTSRPLVVAAGGLPSNFDMEQPAGFQNDLGADLFQSIYEQLTSPRAFFDEQGFSRIDWRNLRHDLAESWWFSDDWRTCTFRLRRGVRSHDGNELTAEDVKWGWERAFAVRDVGKWVARVSSVQDESAMEVVDRYTIAYHLVAPNPLLPRAMAQCTPTVYDTTVLKDHISTNDPWAKEYLATHPAAFGPYKLVAYDDKEIVLRAHEGHWRGKPPIDEVIVHPYESMDERIDDLLAGKVDIVHGIPFADLPRLRNHRATRISAAWATPGLILHLDLEAEPLNRLEVRQAIAMAVPIQEIIQTVYLGGARPWHSWVQPEAPGYAADSWPYSEDIAGARKLLAGAGFPNGFETEMLSMPGDGVDLAGQILRDGLARIGIVVTEKPPIDNYYSIVGAPKANLAPLMLRGSNGRGHRVFDPQYALYHDYSPGRMRLVRFTYDNPVFYEALRGIAEAGSTEKWEAATAKAQSILNYDAAFVPICAPYYYVAHNAELTGCGWYPDNRLPFYDMAWRD